MLSTRWKTLALVVAAVLLAGAAAWAAETLLVQHKKAAIREGRRKYKPRLATLEVGDEVTVLRKRPPWLRVKARVGDGGEQKDVEGWMHESDVTGDEDRAESGKVLAVDARTREPTLAGRGFGPEVEKQYRRERTDNRKLQEAFAVVDAIEELVFPEEDLGWFLRAGRLAEWREGGE